MAIVWSSGDVWITLTAYAVGARVVSSGNVYQCSVAGTSGAVAPSGTTSPQTDGSVSWLYLGVYNTFFALGFAPELATGTPAITLPMQTMYLTLAEILVADVSIWIGGLLDPGRAACAAHLGELARLQGRGSITAEAVGPISQNNAALMGESAMLLTTAGRAYLDLVNTTPAIFGFMA